MKLIMTKDSFCSTFTNKPMNPNELKSAKEWSEVIVGWMLPENEWALFHNDPTDSGGLVDIIKQIQLNAFRAGMTEAAEITKQGDGYEHKAGYWSEKILAARNKKESL